jgi:hypothetical protein
MRKLLLVLLAFIAVFTYIRALENDPEPAEIEIVSVLNN